MVLRKTLICVSFCLALSCSARVASRAANPPVQKRFFSAPIVYDSSFTTEHERLGYQLPIVPNPVAFSPDGRAYIRQGDGVTYLNTTGEWSFTSFLPAVSDASGQSCSGIDMFPRDDLRIVFDKAGYAYTPVLAHFGKTMRPFILIKSPGVEQWRAYSLPFGDPRMEWFSGAKMLGGPPAVLLYKYDSKPRTISLVDVRREQGKISISKPQEVSRNVLAIAMLGSGGSIVVRSGEWIYTVFAVDTPPPSMIGTPEMWARWSPLKDLQPRQQLLGMSISTPVPDSHDYPVVVSDSRGCLHAVLGAHNGEFQYTRTLNSADQAQISWTKPVLIKETKDDQERSVEPWRLTYPELVCDSKDTLHLVARQWTRGKGQKLVYLKKAPGKNWTKPLELVVPSHRGYMNCYHRLMKDSKDRLFLTYYVYFNHFTEEQARAYRKKYPKEKLVRGLSQGFGRFSYEGTKRHGPYMLVSEDGGDSWRMAVMDDLKPQ